MYVLHPQINQVDDPGHSWVLGMILNQKSIPELVASVPALSTVLGDIFVFILKALYNFKVNCEG